MRNDKIAVTMFMITFVFIVFCFWLVGCSQNTSSSAPQICVENEATAAVNGTVYTEQSPECDYEGTWF